MSKHGIGDMNPSGPATNKANKFNSATGGSTGNGMHKVMLATGGKTMPKQMNPIKTAPERMPKGQHRGKRPASNHLSGQPAVGKSGGAIGGQTVDKIL